MDRNFPECALETYWTMFVIASKSCTVVYCS